MILTEEMIVAALRFRATKLWDRFNDGMIFAVRLPDGENGYCCVMGQKGEHFSLALYRGPEGFSTYLNTVHPENLTSIDLFERTTTFDFVSCDFENVSEGEITPEAKSLIKEVAKKNGLKIGRPKGWPTFVRINNGHNSIGLQNEKDCQDITVALKAGLAVADKTDNLDLPGLIGLGLNPHDLYAPIEGGKVIPLLVPTEDGSFRWEEIATPELVEDKYPDILYNDAATAERLKKMRHQGILQCRLIHLPAPVGSPENSYYATMLLVVNKLNGEAVPIMSRDENTDDETLGNIFASTLANSGVCPTTIEVCDDRTEAMLDDFCEKTGIKLAWHESLKTLDRVRAQLFFQIRGL